LYLEKNYGTALKHGQNYYLEYFLEDLTEQWNLILLYGSYQRYLQYLYCIILQ